ncbi:MAG: hypothetical protein M1817_006890 [Caeruleum heppii]|nr:MAG: hypothetical protein M1817_006890 [Caeruleum heppii]
MTLPPSLLHDFRKIQAEILRSIHTPPAARSSTAIANAQPNMPSAELPPPPAYTATPSPPLHFTSHMTPHQCIYPSPTTDDLDEEETTDDEDAFAPSAPQPVINLHVSSPIRVMGHGNQIALPSPNETDIKQHLSTLLESLQPQTQNYDPLPCASPSTPYLPPLRARTKYTYSPSPTINITLNHAISVVGSRNIITSSTEVVDNSPGFSTLRRESPTSHDVTATAAEPAEPRCRKRRADSEPIEASTRVLKRASPL